MAKETENVDLVFPTNFLPEEVRQRIRMERDAENPLEVPPMEEEKPMTQTEQPDLKPVIAAIYAELAALWAVVDTMYARLGSNSEHGMKRVADRKATCAAISQLFGPEREITHDELLAYYKAWGGQ